MTEASRSTDESAAEAPAGEPRATIEGTEHRISGDGEERRPRAAAAREAIVELGDRARAVVEELARHARERREAAAARAANQQAAPASPDRAGPGTGDASAMALLPQRLGEIRAYMGEVADVLEATIERLETVENQLGDPDENIERQLADGIARCERVLMGIEHRVDVTSPAARAASSAQPVTAAPQGGPVLVVSRSSRRRGELCIAVEHEGLQAVAAHDLASALRAALRASPRVGLIDLDGTPGERIAQLEEWSDYQERGALPPAAAIGTGESEGARHGFEVVREEHGAAAMAAVLVRLVRSEPAGARDYDSGSHPKNEERTNET
jgi:hypothetical protein